jgi:hypothetical protein
MWGIPINALSQDLQLVEECSAGGVTAGPTRMIEGDNSKVMIIFAPIVHAPMSDFCSGRIELLALPSSLSEWGRYRLVTEKLDFKCMNEYLLHIVTLSLEELHAKSKKRWLTAKIINICKIVI